ncbi:unnamed protein product [Paramecium sonneborni]|uniref:Uncharacterized protein n=1 Tax=Paramecium sonneborni TaxID=65129 RepID=A0A8S1MV37_9CILI|nr:unnamed protein product [Paramecium sonneborni]
MLLVGSRENLNFSSEVFLNPRFIQEYKINYQKDIMEINAIELIPIKLQKMFDLEYLLIMDRKEQAQVKLVVIIKTKLL